MATPEHITAPHDLFSDALTRELAAARADPSTHGLALMGTAKHGDVVLAAAEALSRHFRYQPGLFIAIQLPLCHDPDDKRHHVVPDLLVAHSNLDRDARAYYLWEEPTPHFVLEVASESTVDRDLGFKKWEYQRLGVLEYWQLDQSGELLPQPLLGHRLSGQRRYRQLRPSGLVEGRETYYSAALGLELRSRGQGLGLELVFRDPQSGEDIPVGVEMDRACHAAERAAEAERSARLVAEGVAEAERSARLAAEERLARAEEALRRGSAPAGSDLD